MIPLMRHNLSLKLWAILIAITTWGFLRILDPVEQREMVFALEERLGQKALINRFPQDVTVNAIVTGPVSQLDKLQALPLKAILDGRSIPPGGSSQIRPKLERRFTGVKIEFEPDSFFMEVDVAALAKFEPVEMGIGTLPSGYYIDERINVPQEIVVDGAKSLVDRIDQVIYYLPKDNMTGSTELLVDFIPLDTNGVHLPSLTLTPPSAEIQISLRSSEAFKTVPVVVDYQGNPATNYILNSISTTPPMVDVNGSPEGLLNIVSVRTAPIELTGKRASFSEVVPLVSPGEGIILSISEARVTVEITQIDTTFTFDDLLVEQRGMSDNFDYALSTDRIDVTIRGNPARVSEVTASLIRPQVDLGGLGPGTHSVPVSVALPSEVRKDRVSPSAITVIVTEVAVEPEPEPTPPEESVDGVGDGGVPEEPPGTPEPAEPE